MRTAAEIVVGAALAVCLLRLLLTIAPVFGGNAFRRVHRQIRHNAVVFHSARRRPWWQFW